MQNIYIKKSQYFNYWLVDYNNQDLKQKASWSFNKKRSNAKAFYYIASIVNLILLFFII